MSALSWDQCHAATMEILALVAGARALIEEEDGPNAIALLLQLDAKLEPLSEALDMAAMKERAGAGGGS